MTFGRVWLATRPEARQPETGQPETGQPEAGRTKLPLKGKGPSSFQNSDRDPTLKAGANGGQRQVPDCAATGDPLASVNPWTAS